MLDEEAEYKHLVEECGHRCSSSCVKGTPYIACVPESVWVQVPGIQPNQTRFCLFGFNYLLTQRLSNELP